MSDQSPDSDDALGARLRTELRRYTAPAYLRGSVVESAEPPRARPSWLAPTLAAAAMALVLGLAAIPFLPRILPADPTERLVRSVVAEHTRALMWGARRPEGVPTALPWLTQESGIALPKFFGGDDHLVFVGAEPVYLEGRRGMALYYRDGDGHLVTYAALPAPGLSLPESRRVQIQNRWRPALMSDSGFSAWVWRQGDLACFIVADMVSESDIERFKDYFVRLRVSTDPVPAN
jgi:hypothetical protein